MEVNSKLNKCQQVWTGASSGIGLGITLANSGNISRRYPGEYNFAWCCWHFDARQRRPRNSKKTPPLSAIGSNLGNRGCTALFAISIHGEWRKHPHWWRGPCWRQMVIGPDHHTELICSLARTGLTNSFYTAGRLCWILWCWQFASLAVFFLNLNLIWDNSVKH